MGSLNIKLYQVVFFVLLGCLGSFAQNPPAQPAHDSTASSSVKDTSSLRFGGQINDWFTQNDTVFITLRKRTTTIVAWPFEKIIQPIFDLLLSPLGPPIRYIEQENITNKALNLITYGEKDQILVYPMFLAAGPNSSMVGMTYHHKKLLFDLKDWLRLSFYTYTNGDLWFFSRYIVNNIAGSKFRSSFKIRKSMDQNDGMYPPYSNQSFAFTDSSLLVSGDLYYPLNDQWSIVGGLGFLDYLHSTPLSLADTLIPTDYAGPFGDPSLRGMYQNFKVIPTVVELQYSTKDNPYTTTQGSTLHLILARMWVSDYSGPLAEDWTNEYSHNYTVLKVQAQRYFLLGTKEYKLSREEMQRNRAFFQNFNLSKARQLFGAENVRETFFEKKVLVLEFELRQFWEDQYGAAPFTAYEGLGEMTPIRGYGGNRFTEKALLSTALEYRWPFMNYVDGVFFNEYGIYSGAVTSPDFSTLKNSWGFGIRARTKNEFIFRGSLSFHGAQWGMVTFTTSAAF
jgi:hypothetical protein